ncbi:MAG TPA: tetratricopeptide repeat protein, partial [Bacillota bacterium]
MKTKSKLLAAFALSVAMVGAASFGPSDVAFAQDKKETPKVSRALAKPLKAAQDAMNAKKYDEALAKLKEAQGMSGRSAYDDYLISEMLGYIYVRTGKYSEAAKALEAGLNSGYLDESEVPTRIKALAQVNYQIKNYDKAIEYGNRAIKNGQGDEDMYTLVSQAYYIKGDYKGTLKFLDGYVNSQIKRGQAPKEQTLQLVM